MKVCLGGTKEKVGVERILVESIQESLEVHLALGEDASKGRTSDDTIFPLHEPQVLFLLLRLTVRLPFIAEISDVSSLFGYGRSIDADGRS